MVVCMDDYNSTSQKRNTDIPHIIISLVLVLILPRTSIVNFPHSVVHFSVTSRVSLRPANTRPLPIHTKVRLAFLCISSGRRSGIDVPTKSEGHRSERLERSPIFELHFIISSSSCRRLTANERKSGAL